MPPKKSADANVARKPIVGRLGTNLKMGVVASCIAKKKALSSGP